MFQKKHYFLFIGYGGLLILCQLVIWDFRGTPPAYKDCCCLQQTGSGLGRIRTSDMLLLMEKPRSRATINPLFKRMIRATDSNCYPYLSAAAFTLHQRIYSYHPASFQEKRGHNPCISLLLLEWPKPLRTLTNTKMVQLEVFGLAQWHISIRLRPTGSCHLDEILVISKRYVPVTSGFDHFEKAVPAYRLPSPCGVLQVIRIC